MKNYSLKCKTPGEGALFFYHKTAELRQCWGLAAGALHELAQAAPPPQSQGLALKISFLHLHKQMRQLASSSCLGNVGGGDRVPLTFFLGKSTPASCGNYDLLGSERNRQKNFLISKKICLVKGLETPY